MPYRRACATIVAAVLLGSCVIVRRTEVAPVDTAASSAIATPARLHLKDGSTALVRTPWRIEADSVHGSFAVFDPQLRFADSLMTVPLDRVTGIETYISAVSLPGTVALSTLTTAASIAAGSALYVAIFGSCPTVYADSAGNERLEAEGFSYSIAPLFESRDVDVLRARPGPDGAVRLTVRNEAAETHYINHVELLAVRRGPTETVAPDVAGLPLAMDGWLRYRATNRDGTDITAILRDADTLAYASDSASLASLTDSTLHDWITFHLPAVDHDSVALLIRGRNSLLTTILLYDEMLAAQGAHAVDWIGRDLADLGSVLSLSRWYASELGLHVQVRDGDGWRDVTRMGDPGPIAWEETAVEVPVRRGTPSEVRLRFPNDSWRLDRVQIAGRSRRPAWRAIAPDSLIDPHGDDHADLRVRLAQPDNAYVVTQPGDAFTLTFPTAAADSADQFLLAMQGYYIEWIRPAWAARTDVTAFTPGNAHLRHALERWRDQRDGFEQQFFASRLAVR